MIELVLILVIAILGILLGWQDFNNRKERSKLINAVIAKTSADLRELDFVDKMKVDIKQQPSTPDLVPLDQLSDEEFAEKVGQQHG